MSYHTGLGVTVADHRVAGERAGVVTAEPAAATTTTPSTSTKVVPLLAIGGAAVVGFLVYRHFKKKG